MVLEQHQKKEEGENISDDFYSTTLLKSVYLGRDKSYATPNIRRFHDSRSGTFKIEMSVRRFRARATPKYGPKRTTKKRMLRY